MSERRPIIIFAVFLALMGGVVFFATRDGGKSNNASTDTNDSTIKTTSTTNDNSTTGNTVPGTTTKISIPTTIPSAGPDQYRSILERLIALQNDMLQSPDPARTGEIMDAACTCYTDTRKTLQTLVDNKWHVQGPSIGVSVATLINKTDTQMRISATLSGLGNPTVDQNGKTQQEGPKGPLQPILYVLKKNTSGSWVIADRQAYEER